MMGSVLSCGRSNKRVSANLVVRIYLTILVKSKIHCTIPTGRHPFKSGHLKKNLCGQMWNYVLTGIQLIQLENLAFLLD